jgi:hypothetical protein
MTRTYKLLLPVAILLVAVLAAFLSGCTSEDQSGDRLVLVSSASDLVFEEGKDPDLSKIVFTVVDDAGNILETVYADQTMLSAADINKLRVQGAKTVFINYRDKKLPVQVIVNAARQDDVVYKVYFDCNELLGANGTSARGYFDDVASNIMEADESILVGNKLISLPVPKLDGFRFKGWYTDPNGSGTKLSVTQNYPYILSSVVTTFYAQWSDERTFEVSFINAITGAYENIQIIEYGKSAVLPTKYVIGSTYDFNSVRYVFTGWTVSGSGSYTNVTERTTVYAEFTEYKVNVVFYRADKLTVYRSFDVLYNGTFQRDDIPPVFYDAQHPEAAYTAKWMDFATEDELPYANITGIKTQKKFYIQYTAKMMSLTFYSITREQYNQYGNAAAVPSEYKQIIEVQYNTRLATVPAAPLYPDDPSTTEVNESLKYNAIWKVYQADVAMDPNFSLAVTENKEYFVFYTAKSFQVSFIGYGDTIIRTVVYGEKVLPIVISSAIYNPLVYTCTWHTNAARDNDKIFDFNTRITQSVTLYFKATPKNITVYYCMPAYYTLAGSDNYNLTIDYTVDTQNLIYTINEDSGYNLPYVQSVIDPISPEVNHERSTAYAIWIQSVSSGAQASRPAYDFKKYRQTQYNNGTTKWYDYTKTLWDFSKDFYTELKNYVIANNVTYVVLYAAVTTNEHIIRYKNVSYEYGVEHKSFYEITYGSSLPLTVDYGTAFDPNAYINSLTSSPVNPLVLLVPEAPGEELDLRFDGWYTSQDYRAGSKILIGTVLTVTSDLTFYAKWIDNETGSEGLQYTLIEGQNAYAVSGYVYPVGGEDTLRIPLMHDGLPVTTVYADALNAAGVSHIREVELRSGLMTIEEGAFTSLTGITSFIIRNNISDYFTVSGGVLYTKDMAALIRCPANGGIVMMTIPASVIRINQEAFALCGSLASVVFEDASNILSIGKGAFWECDNLVSVELPSSLKDIGSRAFYESPKLSTLELDPDAVYDIEHCGADAFYGTSWLSGRTGQVILANVLVRYIDQSGVTSIVIDSSVSTVADKAFAQEAVALQLETITFGFDSAIKRIGSLAFNACANLKSIEIRAETIVEIELNAFSGISSGSVLYVAPLLRNAYLNRYVHPQTSEILLDVSAIMAGAW